MKKIFLIPLFFARTALAATYQVLGLGSPCIDHIITVQEADLARFNIEKGGWREMEASDFDQLVHQCANKITLTGDCASNVIKGLASLGMPCALTGNVGKDPLGLYVRQTFETLKVKTLFTETATPTAQIACLVTPDGERSFCCFLKAQHEISEKDLSKNDFEGVKLVHMEGYRLPNGTYMEKSMEMARAAGATISFDVANAGFVKKFRERILALIETYTDILFINEEEAYALTQLPAPKSAQFLKNFCPLVVLKVGEQGCWVCSEEGLLHSPGISAHVVDTTGAGDVFASAFLYGYLNGYSHKASAYFGNLAGSAVIERYGAELPLAKWEEILKKIVEYGER